MEESGNTEFWMTTNRIETLVDGIFAIAMTLLVLNLVVPDIPGPLSEIIVRNAFLNLYDKFFIFVLSFVLLSIFWTIHHRAFHLIQRADRTFLWINLIWLLFIVLVPFTNTFSGDYGKYVISHLVFNIDMLGIAVFIGLSWFYAVKRGLIAENTSKKIISDINRGILVFIFVSLLAIFLSFVIPGWSSLAYILIIPIEIIAKRI
ncbi:MAG: TMEM175 family protein [Methanobacterium sp.]